MRNIFQAPEIEAFLLVDATNAFNSLNWKAAFHNISIICPSLINTYKAPVRLFLTGIVVRSHPWKEHPRWSPGNGHMRTCNCSSDWSSKGQLSKSPLSMVHWWCHRCSNLKSWWDELANCQPSFVYHPNAITTYLVVKKEHEKRAKDTFTNTEMSIATHS